MKVVPLKQSQWKARSKFNKAFVMTQYWRYVHREYAAMKILRYFLNYFTLTVIAFSGCASAEPNYKTPQEICDSMGEKAKNGKALQSINDISGLNETILSCIIAPKSSKEISKIIHIVNEWNKTNKRIHISVAGARHSQGGHIASSLGIVLDLKKYLNKVEKPKTKNGLWTVKTDSGALWSDVHRAISQFEGHSLANKVQQSSTPFTIGGTLSVNAHGRSFSYGSIINSVERFTIVLPDGTITNASRTENTSIFKQAIGGYGLFGIIVDVTLELHENDYLKPISVKFNSPEEYIALLTETLKNTPRHTLKRDKSGSLVAENLSPIAFLFATLSLDSGGFMTKGTAYSYQQTSSVDKTGAVNPDPQPSLLNLRALVTKIGFSLKRKGFLVTTAQKAQYKFLMTQNTRLKVLTPPIQPILAAASKNKPDLLQEYFIPINRTPEFLSHVKKVFSNNNVILSNVSLRFIPKSRDSSVLTYESATEDQLAIVLYFSLKLNKNNIAEAKIWTQELVEKSIALKGRYYLPYQEWPRKEQFMKAYPSFKTFKERKIAADPNEVFSNKFYQYYLN